MTTMLFNDKPVEKKKAGWIYPWRKEMTTSGDFNVDNEGDLVFNKFYRNNNDYITKVT